jgi:hypothetical protein
VHQRHRVVDLQRGRCQPLQPGGKACEIMVKIPLAAQQNEISTLKTGKSPCQGTAST